MTEQSRMTPWELDPYNERIEIIAKELELAVRWQRPCVLLVVYSSEYVRADVETALENNLIDIGQKVNSLRIKNQNARDIVPFLKEFKNPENTVFFIDGLRWGQDPEVSVYKTLNLQREFFTERQVRVIFWLTCNEIVNLARNAPDFWATRSRVIEFAESPKAEQVLQGMLESAWQGIGEYADQADDTDAKILLRESLLTELPANEEASSTRANLLLTLGVLNWRKGDYEKADEQLREALKIASMIQDNWFEAECFNAIALVKTSMERIGDAIDAYKQAIRLAPKQIFAWNNLGNLCSKIGRNDEAIIAFLKAVECNPSDPIAWNGLGNVYFIRHYVDDAIAAYRKSIHFMPTFSHPWNGLGDVYASTGRIHEAIKAYRKAIDLNQLYITPWIRLGVLYNKQEDYREAIRAYEKALQLDPRNSVTWNDLGLIHMKVDAYEDAAAAFSKAIDLDHGNGWAYSNLALAQSQQGKYEQAVPVYQRAIELLQDDKQKAITWNRLADIYRLLNDYNNAIAAYQTADMLERGNLDGKMKDLPEDADSSKPAPQDAVLPEELTPIIPEMEPQQSDTEACALWKEEPVQASEDEQPMEAPAWIYEHAQASEVEIPTAVRLPTPGLKEEDLKVFPFQKSSKVSKGDAMPKSISPVTVPRKSANPAPQPQAEELKAAEVENLNAYGWNEKGNLLFKSGVYDEAIAAYHKAIQIDPAFGWPYCNLALTYVAQGQNAEAILLYQKSIALLKTDQDKAVSWNGLGNVYRRINDYVNAVAAFQKAAELDPRTAGMRDGADTFQVSEQPRRAGDWNDMGELYFKTGSYEQAIKAFNQAIELEPQNGWAYCNLARVLAVQGHYTEAVTLYTKSIDLLPENKDKAAVWNHLGNAFRKLNDYDNAIKSYQNAVVLADEGVSLLTRTRFSLLSNCYADQD